MVFIKKKIGRLGDDLKNVEKAGETWHLCKFNIGILYATEQGDVWANKSIISQDLRIFIILFTRINEEEGNSFII